MVAELGERAEKVQVNVWSQGKQRQHEVICLCQEVVCLVCDCVSEIWLMRQVPRGHETGKGHLQADRGQSTTP